MPERVVPQRCKCGPLPTQTSDRSHECACEIQWLAQSWGDTLAWFQRGPVDQLLNELAEARDQVKQHHEEMAEWETQAERTGDELRAAIKQRDETIKVLRDELAQTREDLDEAQEFRLAALPILKDQERRADRYIRACKLMHRKWKWLVESEWGDCYGVYPHLVKRRIAELRADLLERCEAMGPVADLSAIRRDLRCPDCNGLVDEGLNPYEDGYYCPGCQGYIEYHLVHP